MKHLNAKRKKTKHFLIASALIEARLKSPLQKKMAAYCSLHHSGKIDPANSGFSSHLIHIKRSEAAGTFCAEMS